MTFFNFDPWGQPRGPLEAEGRQIIIHFIMLIISGSDQEKFEISSFVTRKTVGTVRIVAYFSPTALAKGF